jgi:hypothetical protein
MIQALGCLGGTRRWSRETPRLRREAGQNRDGEGVKVLTAVRRRSAGPMEKVGGVTARSSEKRSCRRHLWRKT